LRTRIEPLARGKTKSDSVAASPTTAMKTRPTSKEASDDGPICATTVQKQAEKEEGEEDKEKGKGKGTERGSRGNCGTKCNNNHTKFNRG